MFIIHITYDTHIHQIHVNVTLKEYLFLHRIYSCYNFVVYYNITSNADFSIGRNDAKPYGLNKLWHQISIGFEKVLLALYSWNHFHMPY